jgi:HEAT repeat protein
MRRTDSSRSKAYQGLLDELARAGFSLKSLDDLRRSGHNYEAVVPILLGWLPKMESVQLKESVVRALSVPWAKSPPVVAALVQEFRLAKGDLLRWAIGNAIEVVAGKDDVDALTTLAQDRTYGIARQMIVLALGRMERKRAEPLLLRLLDDEDVAGHAVMALGKLRSKAAVGPLKRMLKHSKKWLQKEAAKSLREIG